MKGREPVAALKEGTYFGEVALLVPGVRRSGWFVLTGYPPPHVHEIASVVATTFCEVLVLDKDDFEVIFKAGPFHLT